MIISLIAAMSENRIIGVDNKLPWHLPADLKRFKALTLNHPVVMGRKTYDSVGAPLPQRTNIIITRNRSLVIPGVRVVSSLDEALEPYKKTNEEVFILGGGEIFAHSMDIADRIYLTVIHKEFHGDALFPEVPAEKFRVVSEEKHGGDLPFTFRDFHRK